MSPTPRSEALPLEAAPMGTEDTAAVERPKPRSMDLTLFVVALALGGFGLVMVYSASAVYAFTQFGSDTYFAKRQLFYLIVGVTITLVASRVDPDLYRRHAMKILVAGVVLLALVLLPGLGTRVGGAQRWFRFGPVSIQPSELGKLSLIMFLASILAAGFRGRATTIREGLAVPLLVVGLVTGLTVMQPDLGTAVLLVIVALLMMFVAGTRLRYILSILAISAPLAWFAVVNTPWRVQRLMAFFDPETHKQGAGYQVYESLLTMGSGGWSGIGLGEGQQKLFYLPEAHTDFILPVIGQELGFIGVMLVLALVGVILWRGCRAAWSARDRYSAVLAFGLSAMLGVQALINMAVVLGVLPTKGITLPFVSFGGSSLFVSFFAVGVLLSISRRTPAPVSAGRLRASTGRGGRWRIEPETSQTAPPARGNVRRRASERAPVRPARRAPVRDTDPDGIVGPWHSRSHDDEETAR